MKLIPIVFFLLGVYVLSVQEIDSKKIEYYSRLVGIISPNQEYTGRGKIPIQRALQQKHYRFYFSGKQIDSIKYFNKNIPSDDSYFGTHQVKYSHSEGNLSRTYFNAKNEKATFYRHYYLGNNLHEELFKVDSKGNKTSLILKDSLGVHVSSGLGSYRFEFKKIDHSSFIQKQFTKNGKANVLTHYFPFEKSKISTDTRGFLKTISNLNTTNQLIHHPKAGFAKVVFNYDSYGNEMGWEFQDLHGNLANRRDFMKMDFDFAKVVYQFEWTDEKLGLYKSFTESYLDENRKPTENQKGIHKIIYEFDENDNFIGRSLININGDKINEH